MAWKKGKPAKRPHQMKRFSSNRTRVRSQPLTSLARAFSESKDPSTKEDGAAALYRDHVQSGGSVTHANIYSHPRVRPTKKLPPTRWPSLREYEASGAHSPVMELIKERISCEEWQSERRIGWDHWHVMYLVDLVYTKVIMCFSGQRTFFVVQDLILRRVKASRFYTSERARELIQGKEWNKRIEERIDWFHKGTLPSSEQDTPG